MKGFLIFLKIILIIFLVELAVMSLLFAFEVTEEPMRSLLDGILLAVLSAPFLFSFVIKPVSRRFTEQIIQLEEKSLSLQQSESTLQEERSIFVSGPVVVFKWEPREGRPINYVSPNVEEVLGYTVKDFVGGEVRYADIIYSPDLLSVGEKHNRNVEEKVPFFDSEYRVVRKDGTILWVYDVTSVIRDEAGNIKHFHAYVLNLTKRKKIESLFYSLFDNAIEGIWVLDGGWKTMQMNQRMADILDVDAFTMSGASIFDFIPNEADRAFLNEEHSANKGEFHFEVNLKKANGETVSCLLNMSPLTDFGGNRTGFLAFVTDLTEKRKIEKALIGSEEKFRKMFASHSAAMLLVEPSEEGYIIDANDAAAKFYATSIEKLKMMRNSDLNTLPGTRLGIEMRRALDGHRNLFLFKHRIGDGSVRDVEVHSSPVDIMGKTLLFSIVHDVTERMRFENELRIKKEELEYLNKHLEKKVAEEVKKRRSNEQILIQQSKLAAMGEMIGAIAHQWRQPLNALGLLIQDLQDAHDFGELDEAYIAEMVRKSMTQIDFMSRTIDDFRNFFRQDKEKRSFKVYQSIQEVLGLIANQLGSHMILYKLECEEELKELSLLGYPNEFKQVILNLVANAKDALVEMVSNGNRDRTVYGNIVIRLEKKGGTLLIVIEDDAGGIPKDILDRIFEPYFTTKEEGKGTGIGLYMSRTIIEKNMNGKLIGENITEGGGARFTIELNLEGRCSEDGIQESGVRKQ